MLKLAPLTLALVTSAVLLAPPLAAAQTAEQRSGASPRASVERTPFALSGSGFGTRARGGEVPAGSDSTAWQSIGCTNAAGRDSSNHAAVVSLPGGGTAEQVVSRSVTATSSKETVARTTTSIERVVFGDDEAGRLAINGIRSISRAFHDGTYKSETRTLVADMSYTDASGVTQPLAVPTPDQPVVVPGVAEIEVGSLRERVDADGARARADALRVTLLATGTKVRLAYSAAEISGGIKRGLFGGNAAAARGHGLEEVLSVGRLPLTLMPCAGTDGELVTQAIARADVGENITLRGLRSSQWAEQTRRVADGYERSRVAELLLADGDLLVQNVVGRANVIRTVDSLRRNSDGTRVGKVTYQGEEQEFPDSDVLHIPGVARLERELVERTKNGLTVTALKVTLLDGSGAVLELGKAHMRIADSKL